MKVNYDRHTHVSSEHRLFDLKLNEVWRYRDLTWLFTKRTFTVKYKQTILGPLWLILNPLLTSFIYVVLFGNIAKLGTDGIPQMLFYLGGTALWTFFSSCLTDNSSTFIENAQLFGKVYFPRLVMPISKVIGSVILFGIQMIPVALLMLYYIAKGALRPHYELWPLILLLLLWLGLLGMGLGILISGMTTKYRDLSVLVSFGMQLLMYGTPVVYPLTTVPESLKTLALINPVTMPMEIFRYILFGTGSFCLWSALLSLGFTVLAAFAGLVLFSKVERIFIDTV